jgi:hypothetical protein
MSTYGILEYRSDGVSEYWKDESAKECPTLQYYRMELLLRP